MYMGNRNIWEVLLMVKRQKGLTPPLRKKLHEQELAYRNLLREREKYKDDFTWHTYGDYQDSMWGKAVYPNPSRKPMTDEEIAELKEELWEHWYNPYGDGRDCTGVWFTTSIRVFSVEDKIIVYHFKSCDV